MPTIQLTVDDALAHALDVVARPGVARSQLVRELALRGARVVEQEQRAAASAAQTLLAIADGEAGYDLGEAAALHAERDARLPPRNAALACCISTRTTTCSVRCSGS